MGTRQSMQRRSVDAAVTEAHSRMMLVRVPTTSREAFKIALGFTALGLVLKALEKLK